MLYKTDYCCDPVDVLYFVEYETENVTHRIEHYDQNRIEEIFSQIAHLMEEVASDVFPIVSVRWGAVRYHNGELYDEQEDVDNLENYF